MIGTQAIEHGMARCHNCGLASILPQKNKLAEGFCKRCDSHIELRQRGSLSKTLALLITAALLMIPANIYPVMTVVSFGKSTEDTIISGVIHLLHAGLYPISLLVFVASILVPAFKIIGLLSLLVVIHYKVNVNRRQASVMFRFIHFIGRWSMLDLFMISILVTLVDVGAVATIQTGPGSTAFAGVVVITMLATHTFDQRLLWDYFEGSTSNKT